MSVATESARWERYAAAADGLPEYWHPAMPSAKLGRKPKSWRLLGRDLVFVRHARRAYALEDRCPHRHIPLSKGRCEFPGTITCIYHGWTFDLADGKLVAALTDGPDSPVRGMARARSYPVEERCGMVWVWMGEGTPVPVEDDIPDELLRPDARIYALYREAEGDWRHAAENGFDEAHGKMLHRSSWWVVFRRMAGWNETEIVRGENDRWLSRYQHSVHEDDDYPGLGSWPSFNFWQRRRKSVAQGSNEHTVVDPPARQSPGAPARSIQLDPLRVVHAHPAGPLSLFGVRGRLGAGLAPSGVVAALLELHPLGPPLQLQQPGSHGGAADGRQPPVAFLPPRRVDRRLAPHGRGRGPRAAALESVRSGLNRSRHAPLDTALRAYSG